MGAFDTRRAGPAHALTPLAGTEALRVQPRSTVADRRFTPSDPLVFELQLPPGTLIPGGGPPPDIEDTGDASAPGYPRALDRSVVQLELPVHAEGKSDEDPFTRSVGMFDRPIFCPVGRPCLWPEDSDGLWRAWRIRDDGTGPVATELQLGGVGGDIYEDRPLYQVVGVWLDPGDVPLDEHDRVRFEFVGDVPRRSTTWLGDPLRAHLRTLDIGVDTGSATCFTWDLDCWHVLDPIDVQGFDVEPGPPAFAKVVAPLDTEVDVPFALRIVLTDAWGNPSPHAGLFQPTLDGVPLGPALDTAGGWRADGTVTLTAPGLGILGLELPVGLDVAVVQQPTRAAAAGTAPWARKVGDLHFHSGDGGAPGSFAPSSATGDHAAGFTRGQWALRYLDEVAGADFGALSEHATRHVEWAVPGPEFSDFMPGGPCAVDTEEYTLPSNWWRRAQQIAHDYGDTRAHFTSFPAFEWHSQQEKPGDRSPLHRVVLYRSFDTTTPHDLPMLPGSTMNLPPQCLIRYLMLAGYGPDEVLAMPHVMAFHRNNVDWDRTFGSGATESLASRADVDAYTPLVEMYSARNPPGNREEGRDQLCAAEGRAPDPRTQPYSVRYGWQLGARVGVVGASDSHSQMPGVNNDADTSGARYHAHEAGGLAVVLTDPAQGARDGIFDALQGKRSYATTGIRAWLDFTAEADGAVAPMGSELDGTCSVHFDVELAAGLPIRRLTVFRSRLSPGAEYEVVASTRPETLVERISVESRNPRLLEHGADDTWVYYARGLLGPPTDPEEPEAEQGDGDEEAVWSSPIWIRWSQDCSEALSLEVGPIVAGQDATLSATGAGVGDEVAFLRGRVGDGPCPSSLGGMCLGLQDVRELGRATADAAGRAELTLSVPPTWPCDRAEHFQAAVVAGAESRRSPVVRRRTGVVGHSDPFDGDALDASWQVLPGSLHALWVDGGSAWLAPEEAAPWRGAATGPLVYKELAGDVSVRTTARVRLVSDPELGPAAAGDQGGLMMRSPGAAAEDHVAVWVGLGAGGLVIAHTDTDEGVDAEVEASWPVAEAELQLCREGAQVGAFWRLVGGSEWTAGPSWSRADLPATLQVGMVARTDEAIPDLQVDFDRVDFRDVGVGGCPTP